MVLEIGNWEAIMSETVICDISGGIAVVTLNRPQQLNALNYAMIDRLLSLLDAIDVDDAVRALILTGAGDKAFSAGADIYEFSASVTQGPAMAVRDFVRRGQTMTARLEAFRKPVIAAVNGLAFGGGCEITEASHLAIASTQASFAKPEIKLGMPPTFGGTQRLPRLAGRKRALALLLSGDPFTPAHAQEIGLVNSVVPHDQLLSAARELAGSIIRHSPRAVAAIAAATTRGLNMSIDEGLLVERTEFAALAADADLSNRLDIWIARDRHAGPAA